MRLVDLSVAGLGIASPVALEPGASVTFELETDGAAVSGEGRVIWSRPQRRDRDDMATLGVRIVALGQAGFERLDALVEGHLRRRPARSAPPVAAKLPPLSSRGSTLFDVDPVEEREAPVPAPGAGPTPLFQRRFLMMFAALVLVISAGLFIAPRLVGRSEPLPQVAPADLPSPSAREEPTAPNPILVEPSPSEQPEGAAPSQPTGPSTAPAKPGGAPTIVESMEVWGTSTGSRLLLTADRPILAGHVFTTLIGPDPPRYLIRISGIQQRGNAIDLTAETGELVAIRTGLHDTARGPELHVVVDLTSRDLEIDLMYSDGSLAVDFDPPR